MPVIFTINNLTYKQENKLFFKNLNLEIEEKDMVSIIAPNRSGKTILTKIISAIIPTDDICILKGISLNKKNVLKYITKLGIVTNDLNSDFLFKKVKDELAYPLLNLGFPEQKINKKITAISHFFEIQDILNKKITKLSLSEQKKLKIITSLVHEPRLLVLDDAFFEMNKQDQEFILKKLKELNKRGLTILNITSKLDTIYDSNKVYVLENSTLKYKGSPSLVFENDSYLRKIGLTIPFIVDLSIKLKFYNLIDKIYFDLEELEEDLWK